MLIMFASVPETMWDFPNCHYVAPLYRVTGLKESLVFLAVLLSCKHLLTKVTTHETDESLHKKMALAVVSPEKSIHISFNTMQPILLFTESRESTTVNAACFFMYSVYKMSLSNAL